jgi:CheY-like chemotaxis protein
MPLFNLCHSPSRMVFLDDDAFFLDVFSLAIPSQWRIDLFTDIAPCLDFLQQNGELQKTHIRLQHELVQRSRSDESMIPLVLQYWQHHPERYDLVELAIFDYAMPGLNGLDALARLTNWDGRRALLTGQADESIAVTAFNSGAIHQFISKQSTGLRASLIAQLQPLLDTAPLHRQVVWQQGLSASQLQSLSEPAVVHSLSEWLKAQDCVEYVVTDVPFGVLMVSSKGIVKWLQLESKDHLEDLVELASDDLPLESMASVLRGEALVNIELSLALGGLAGDCPVAVSPAFKVGDSLLGVGHTLGDNYDLSPEQSYQGWCDNHPKGGAHFRTWHGVQSANPKV